jgi:uncharacterized protein YbjT (DUF2867 family)
MVLVAGSTGYLGAEICRQLREKGVDVRALVRKSSNPERLSQLKDWGCELVFGDLKDPQSLKAACDGAETVISTVTSMVSRQEGDDVVSVDQDGQVNLVHAAANAGAGQFILIAFPDSRNHPHALNDAKRTVEKAMERSGMAYTSIMANNFMETWLSPVVGFDYPSGKVVIFGEANNPVAFVSLGDVAQLAVACVGHPQAKNKYIPFGGPDNLSYRQVVEIFEGIDGRAYEVTAVPSDGLKYQLAQATNPIESIYTSLMLASADGIPMDCAEIYTTFDIKPTSVADFARRALGKS